MIESKKLEEQLQKLGFAESKEMLRDAIILERIPTEAPQIKNTHALYHFFDELNVTADCALIIGETAPDQWVIHSIETSIQIESDKTIEGVDFLNKSYLQQDGPLPNIEQIKKDILQMVRMHEIKERFSQRLETKINKGKNLGI